MDKQYKERWDFKLIEPWYMKKAGDLQWKMYEGYRDDAKFILNMWEHPETITALPDPNFVNDGRQRRDRYSEEYFKFFDDAVVIQDWRKFFGRVPISAGCTSENTNIPNTSGSIKSDKEQESSPSGVPIDPYTIS